MKDGSHIRKDIASTYPRDSVGHSTEGLKPRSKFAAAPTIPRFNVSPDVNFLHSVQCDKICKWESLHARSAQEF